MSNVVDFRPRRRANSAYAIVNVEGPESLTERFDEFYIFGHSHSGEFTVAHCQVGTIVDAMENLVKVVDEHHKYWKKEEKNEVMARLEVLQNDLSRIIEEDSW